MKNVVVVGIKRLYEDAKLPYKKHPTDAGWDLYAHNVNNTNEDYVEYGTGLCFEIPEGYVGLVFPRSSVTEKDLVLKNSVGVIDSSYRGEIRLRFYRLGKDFYNIGDRIGQIIIIPFPQIYFWEKDELSDTERSGNGFGSTGK